jgi:Anti-sigma-K factor rskA
MSDEVEVRRRARALEAAPDGVDDADQAVSARLRLLLGRPGTWGLPPVGLPDLGPAPAGDDEPDVTAGWVDVPALDLPVLAGAAMAADVAAGEVGEVADEGADEAAGETVEKLDEETVEKPAGDTAAATADETGDAAEADPAVVDLGRRRLSRRGRRTVGFAAAAAAAAVVVFGLSVLVPSQRTGKAELAGTAAAPQARARVAVVSLDAGAQFTLYIDGLPPAAPGTYYEAWLLDGTAPIPLGSFHLHRPGAVVVWSGVEWSGREFTVTRQRVDGGLVPGERVLDGRLPTT